MEEYLKVLMEQIRCKKAHPYIREEIKGHMEAQMEENMLAGMSMEEAERAAVADMGSPIEAGIELDRVHRPKTNWGLIGLMALIGAAGVVLHELMWRQAGLLASGSLDFVKYTIVGFALMLIVYRIDYSVVARFAKIIAAGMIGVCLIAQLQGNMFGGLSHLRIFGWNFAVYFPMLLYIPLYGAVIYKYYGQGYIGLFKAVLWMLVPAVSAFCLPQLMLSLVMFFSMMVILTVALVHDWFRVAKKKVIAVLWGCGVGLPSAVLAGVLGFGLLESHQITRIKAFLENTDNQGANYVTWHLREMLAKCQFIGSSAGNWGESENWANYIPECNTGYVFSYILQTYGILAGIILCGILVILIILIFRISFKQKNQLAMCMGCGCGMVLGLNVAINIAENIGLFPVTETFLPFFSRGGSGVLVCYVLMGIILSIYRYKNIYPAQVDTKLPEVKIRVSL